MARHNLVFLHGYVALAQIHAPSNGQPYAIAYIVVGRADRPVGDHKDHMRCDSPTIMSRDPKIIREIATWKEFDIVSIKGTLAAKTVGKASECSHCGTRNVLDGTLVYVNPIYAKKMGRVENADAGLSYLAEHREVSNQAFIFGTLCVNPKKVTPKEGLIVTQYQVALNRKFHIQADPPEIRTDYPWVKSYGENALSDRKFLHIGSQIFVDGCLQARKVNRHTVCPACGQKYDFADKALEIVPYETEYIANFDTKEEADAKEAAITHEKAMSVLSKLTGYAGMDDMYTPEDIQAGIDSEESD